MQRRVVDMDKSLIAQRELALDTNQQAAQTLKIVESLYYILLRGNEALFVQAGSEGHGPGSPVCGESTTSQG